MNPLATDAVARALFRAREAEDFGRSAWLGRIEEMAEDIADIFAATDASFSRGGFLAKSGFGPQPPFVGGAKIPAQGD